MSNTKYSDSEIRMIVQNITEISALWREIFNISERRELFDRSLLSAHSRAEEASMWLRHHVEANSSVQIKTKATNMEITLNGRSRPEG